MDPMASVRALEEKPATEPLLAEPTDGAHGGGAPAKASFRDTPAAFMLVANLGLLTYFAVTKSGDALDDAAGDATAIHLKTSTLSYMIAVTAGGGVLSAVAMLVLMKMAGAMIKYSLWASIALWAFALAAALAYGQLSGAFFCAIFLALSLCYYRMVRHRIPFAAANLTVACEAIADHVGVVVTAFGGLLVSVAFVALWVFGAAGALSSTTSGDCSGDDASAETFNDETGEMDDPNACTYNYGVCVWLFLSVVWGLQTVAYVIHLTTAGAVAAWWFTPGTAAVGGALCRATTTSFGTASLAAFILAVLETLKQMAHAAARRRGGNAGEMCMACLAQCILGCLERIMRYFNKWALTYAGVYGDSFWNAGKAVIALFSRAGWDALINDQLIDNALAFACLFVGALTAGVGALAGVAADASDAVKGSLAAVGFVVGYYLCAIVMKVLQSAVCTVFVCFAEDAPALARTRPSTYNALVAGWRAMDPQLLAVVVPAGQGQMV